ncbi:B- and T-lymphocyte attenuator-like [Mugil cephalus]|uniref:B- and T-lymphocyte attenuator-like n=1 Tax=Mugil cephalus TaxID=48193 RepID=UPI001FB6DA12|nr:B- and T-lymphocyte attenuator-like [Mugil cephalus]XP_047432000.1 B- and T-lymphocyte attenuator-like [Mugil cephalus]
MTGESFSIMRPKHSWIVLHVSILAWLLLAINADSEESKCDAGIRVRRNTVYNATVGENFKINCPVVFCNNSPPTVSWYKQGETKLPVNVSSHIKTEWEMINDSEGTSILIFRNILMNDSGPYQCRSEGDVSHTINVSVYGECDFSVTQETSFQCIQPRFRTANLNYKTYLFSLSTLALCCFTDNYETTNVTEIIATRDPQQGTKISKLWMYVYCAAGITAFIIIVIIISVISMRRCKGKSKKKPENQYIEIPMIQQPSPRANLHRSPRGSPSVPPSRRSTKRNKSPRQPNELRLSRGNEQLFGEVEEDRLRPSNTGQEEASIVYAALNHHLPPRPAARPRILVEENSEYAAIRVS